MVCFALWKDHESLSICADQRGENAQTLWLEQGAFLVTSKDMEMRGQRLFGPQPQIEYPPPVFGNRGRDIDDWGQGWRGYKGRGSDQQAHRNFLSPDVDLGRSCCFGLG
jgi:hypothetical protein